MIPGLFVAGSGLGFTISPMVNIVLAASRGAETGSASGVLTTVQRAAGAIGVAVVGIVFFILLGSYAPATAGIESAALRQNLQASKLSPQQAGRIAAHFQHCFVQAAASHDPTAAPKGCESLYRQPRLRPALHAADARNYSRSIQYTFVFEIAALLAAVVFVFFLPASDRAYSS